MADGGEEEEDEARGNTTPNTKEAVKSLTTQVSFSLFFTCWSLCSFSLYFAAFCLVTLVVKQLIKWYLNCSTMVVKKGVSKSFSIIDFKFGYQSTKQYRVWVHKIVVDVTVVERQVTYRQNSDL